MPAKEMNRAQLQMVQDKVRRINLKSKRKRTLFKKAIEASLLVNLDILIIIKDRDSPNDKMTVYQSGTETEDLFTPEKALA